MENNWTKEQWQDQYRKGYLDGIHCCAERDNSYLQDFESKPEPYRNGFVAAREAYGVD